MAPVSVRNWLSAAYPTLKIQPAWLDACCEYLASNFQGLSAAQLIKKVEQQILLSSLGDCCDAGTLPTQDLTDTRAIRIASGVKGAILVQVESIFDAGEPALAIKNIHEQRKEELRINQRGGNADRARIIDNVEGQQEENKGPPKYPRSMLTLQLSDGFTVMKAIEYKRIPGLSLEETKLGSKIVLKDVRVLRGILLLEPGNVTLKDHSIHELVEQADAILEEQIRQRLGGDANIAPAQDVPIPAPRAEALERPALPQHRQQLEDEFDDSALFDDMDLDAVDLDQFTASPRAPHAKADDSFDDDFDDADMAELDAIEKAALSGNTHSVFSSNMNRSKQAELSSEFQEVQQIERTDRLKTEDAAISKTSNRAPKASTSRARQASATIKQAGPNTEAKPVVIELSSSQSSKV